MSRKRRAAAAASARAMSRSLRRRSRFQAAVCQATSSPRSASMKSRRAAKSSATGRCFRTGADPPGIDNPRASLAACIGSAIRSLAIVDSLGSNLFCCSAATLSLLRGITVELCKGVADEITKPACPRSGPTKSGFLKIRGADVQVFCGLVCVAVAAVVDEIRQRCLVCSGSLDWHHPVSIDQTGCPLMPITSTGVCLPAQKLRKSGGVFRRGFLEGFPVL